MAWLVRRRTSGSLYNFDLIAGQEEATSSTEGQESISRNNLSSAIVLRAVGC